MEKEVRKTSVSALALTSCAALGGYFHSLNNCRLRVQLNPKGNQPSIFIGRTDAEAETPILWPSEKTLMLVKTEGRKRRGRQRTKWLDSITGSVDMDLSEPRESERAPGNGEGQGSLVCCSPGGRRVRQDLVTG